MNEPYFTIKELTEAVGGEVTPRMVRHYHAIGLLPAPVRSSSNYRLYTDADVQRLRQIVTLKQQGFQLNHIQQLLAADTGAIAADTLLAQLQSQYQRVMQQLTQLRHTASALEGILGRDLECQNQRAEAIAHLRQLEGQLEATAQQSFRSFDALWEPLDEKIYNHPEGYEESLQRLLPDLSHRSQIEVDLLSKLVLACGDVSVVHFVQLRQGVIAAARDALKAGCSVVGDSPTIVAALDHTRLAHLGCSVTTLLDNPHISSAAEAEHAVWQTSDWQERLHAMPDGAIVVIGYAPSILMSVCKAIEQDQIHPALVIGLPIGFSHAPIAKRRLLQTNIPALTIQGSLGGGLLAATALNALADSVIEKPDCHCYLGLQTQ